MDPKFVQTLITYGREDSSMEWKEDLDIHDKAVQAEFIKDMLSLVNAHGTGKRYLLVGIRDDGTIAGVREQVDDARLQQIVNERVEPPIEFTTTYVSVDELTIGVIEITSSPKRPHLVSRDVNGNKGPLLQKGQSWIRKGSSKGPLNAWDHERLREAIAEQSVPQPIIRVSFQDFIDETSVFPVWSKPAKQFAENRLTASFTGLGQPAEPPPGTAELSFVISNDGDQGAEDVVVFMDLPEGCRVWERPYGPGTAIMGGRREVDIWVDEESNRVGMRADGLIHGLHTRPLSANVTFPASDRTYELTWTGHATNMRTSTRGTLRVTVSPGEAWRP